MKVIVPAASFTVTSSIDRLGVASSSVIVPVPAAPALVVVPAVFVAVRVKVSAASSSRSSVIGVRTSTPVVPAAMVALVASAHVVPPSVETWRLPAPAVPKSVPPPSAVTLPSARFTLTGVVERLLRLTANTANGSVPSVTAALLTLRVGVSLSAPPKPVPLSRIVPTPVPSAMPAFTGALSTTLNASLFSKMASLRIVTVIVWLVTPGAKFSVPLVPV